MLRSGGIPTARRCWARCSLHDLNIANTIVRLEASHEGRRPAHQSFPTSPRSLSIDPAPGAALPVLASFSVPDAIGAKSLLWSS